MTTHLDREFGGQLRRFELLNTPVLPYEDDKHGNLATLAMKGAQGLLGADDVRHILVHGLAGGRGSRFLQAQQIVDDAMRGRPLFDFVTLAADVVFAAYGGATPEMQADANR